MRSLQYLQQVGTVFAVVLTFMSSHQQAIYILAVPVIYQIIILQTDPMCLQCQPIYLKNKTKQQKKKQGRECCYGPRSQGTIQKSRFPPDLDFFPFPLFASFYKPRALLLHLQQTLPMSPSPGDMTFIYRASI